MDPDPHNSPMDHGADNLADKVVAAPRIAAQQQPDPLEQKQLEDAIAELGTVLPNYSLGAFWQSQENAPMVVWWPQESATDLGSSPLPSALPQFDLTLNADLTDEVTLSITDLLTAQAATILAPPEPLAQQEKNGTEPARPLPPLVALPWRAAAYLYGGGWVRPQGGGLGLVVLGTTPLAPLAQHCLRQQLALMQEEECPRKELDPTVTCRALAHQIQTPLSLLELYITLLDQAPETCSANVVQTLGQAIHQIQDALTRFCTRSAPDQRDWHDLRPIVLTVVQSLNPWVETQGVQVQIPEEALTLWCDRWQLEQVFLNILNNAVQFSPPQGTIACRWQTVAEGVLIQVQDQGPGLGEGEPQHIFQPAYSRREGGNGLGLAIARRFVLAHRGHIWAEALPIGGTQISVLLPQS